MLCSAVFMTVIVQANNPANQTGRAVAHSSGTFNTWGSQLTCSPVFRSLTSTDTRGQLTVGVLVHHLNGPLIVSEHRRLELMIGIGGEQTDDLKAIFGGLTEAEGHFFILLTDLNDIGLVAVKITAIGSIAPKFHIRNG